ncbi:DUF1699 family protein [uncultured Methanomethylovorans sp.]|uniref:DUF1699 family protein n=1 Tax=uncultured Methanomethylovorans sp. TaxID=183759 RepID=UPI002AA72731|nr:DUF1699 family protein [uncultured Methanomethylovorans sp.]
MKIRVVSSKDEINTLNPNEKIVHFAFRPSNTDILTLIIKGPQVKALHIPTSYLKSISESTIMYLKMQGIELLKGDVWGHRKDINEYYEIPPELFDRLKQLRRDGMPEQDILEKLTRETRLGSNLIEFILKNN